MDHPAFVVTKMIDDHHVEADFRGGVRDQYFVGSKVALHRNGRPQKGTVVELDAPTKKRPDKHVIVEFDRKTSAESGDVITWHLPQARLRGDRFSAPACDDLAGLAAGLAAFDIVKTTGRRPRPDVRLLLTRAEEVGFIGAIGAVRSGVMPKRSRVIVLENSRSLTTAPIGDGPIVRVGDRISTFNPELTYRIAQIAAEIEKKDASFKWQRKLMDGGACEATTFAAFDYTATCICLPLGNTHNMNEAKKKIDSERISFSDFEGLVRLLVEVGRKLDAPASKTSLTKRLDDLFESRQGLLSS
jgi:endoglucanase